MQKIIIFLSILWRNDPQYDFMSWSLSWELAGILDEFSEELAQWERLAPDAWTVMQFSNTENQASLSK
jgi:hypothetical protein